MGFAGAGRLPGRCQAWILGGVGVSEHWCLGRILALRSLCGVLDIHAPVLPFLQLLQESEDPSGKEATEAGLPGVDGTVETLKSEQTLKGDREAGLCFRPFIPAKYCPKHSPS